MIQALLARFGRALPIGLALCWAGAARASSINVDPVLLELKPEAPTTLLDLRNQGTEPARLEISAFAWEESGAGEMKLSPTREVILFPPLLTLAPGEARQIRIGTTAPFGVDEKAFRVLVSELPSAPRPGGGKPAITTVSQFSIPLFLGAAHDTRVLHIQKLALSRRRLTFRLHTEGTVHLRPEEIRLAAVGEGGKVFEHRWSGWYLLPGGERLYEIEVPKATCVSLKRLEVEATLAGSVVTGTLEAGAGGCSD